jgi:hypothetical protein
MSNIWLGKAAFWGIVLLGGSFTFGCTSVVVPLKAGAAALEDSHHGLVFGRVHLTENRKDQHPGVLSSIDLEWLITEESLGRRILIDELPTDGPFVVKLPSGSYHLTTVNLDIVVGVWQASLPATFVVRPGECTYLGTWELDMQTGSFSGSITRRVEDQQRRDEEDLRRIIGASSCPILKAPLELPMDSSITLIDRAEGTELTSSQ